MILKQCFLTNNITYKKQTPIVPRGIVVHSTGVNQTWLGRWVQPSLDDPHRKEIIDDIGYNAGMGWNSPTIDTIVHAMIGLNEKKEMEIYQTLQFDRQCGGCYHGVNGSYNTSHIQFEMQEDGLTDPVYFNNMMNTAIEFCAFLCNAYDIPVSEICSHKEAAARGYASFHGDPENWLERFGWTMNKFRDEVAKKLNKEPEDPTVFKRGDRVVIKAGVTTNYAGKELAKWVYDGRPLYVYGSDEKLTKITIDQSLSAVTATMNTSDLEPYDKQPVQPKEPEMYTITCDYCILLDNGDTESITTKSVQVEAGKAYTIESPKLDYYTPEQSSVSGIATKNTYIAVYCKPIVFTVGILCRDANDKQIKDASGKTYDKTYYLDGGTEYCLDVPVVPGYKPNKDVVEGFVSGNILERVVYTPVEDKKAKLMAAFVTFVKAFLDYFGLTKDDIK